MMMWNYRSLTKLNRSVDNDWRNVRKLNEPKGRGKEERGRMMVEEDWD